MSFFSKKQTFNQILLKSVVTILFVGVFVIAISLLVLVKRSQGDELRSRMKEQEKKIEMLEAKRIAFDIEINDLRKNIVQRAVAVLPLVKPEAIETVSMNNGEYFKSRPRRVRPEQIAPIYMVISRPLQPVRGGVSSGTPGDAVLVEDTNGRRAP
jgi:cell division protein FtsB